MKCTSSCHENVEKNCKCVLVYSTLDMMNYNSIARCFWCTKWYSVEGIVCVLGSIARCSVSFQLTVNGGKEGVFTFQFSLILFTYINM